MTNTTKRTLERCLSNHFNSIDKDEGLVRIGKFQRVFTESNLCGMAVYSAYYGDSLKEIEDKIKEYAENHSVRLLKILTIEEAQKLLEKKQKGERGFFEEIN